MTMIVATTKSARPSSDARMERPVPLHCVCNWVVLRIIAEVSVKDEGHLLRRSY
jgi:hypothetical protein